MKNPRKLVVFACCVLAASLTGGCSSDDSDGSGGSSGSAGEGGGGSGGSGSARPLTPWEDDVVGTWCFYMSTYSEYRCATFNSDRTACYFEVGSVSASATKENKKCYTDWYIDDESEGVLPLYVLGDNTGGEHWAGYQWNSAEGILEGYDGVDRQRAETIPCDFCN